MARNTFFLIGFSYDSYLRSHVDPIFPVILSKSCNCHILSAVNAPERNEKNIEKGDIKYIYNTWFVHAVAITFIDSLYQFILKVL